MFYPPHYSLELAIKDYLVSASLDSSSNLYELNANYYTGYGNDDILDTQDDDNNLPASVIIDASDFSEVVFNSRNYIFTVNIGVDEVASEIITKGLLTGALFNEFTNDATAKVNFSNNKFGIRVLQVRDAKITSPIEGDVIKTTINVVMVGAIVPIQATK